MHMNKREGKMEKKNKELNGTKSKMKEKTGEVENKIDCQEQHSRRYCILIHGIAENKEETTE